MVRCRRIIGSDYAHYGVSRSLATRKPRSRPILRCKLRRASGERATSEEQVSCARERQVGRGRSQSSGSSCPPSLDRRWIQLPSGPCVPVFVHGEAIGRFLVLYMGWPGGADRVEPVPPGGADRVEPVPPGDADRVEPVPPGDADRVEPVPPGGCGPGGTGPSRRVRTGWNRSLQGGGPGGV